MRLAPSLIIASGLALCLVSGLHLLPARAAVPAQRQLESPCTVAADKTVAPSVVPLGQWTQVTLRMSATCPVTQVVPLHVVLVLDTSITMAGEKNQQMKKAVKQMVRDLKLDEHPQIEMGIVRFASEASTLCKLTNESVQLASCANQLGASGGTAIDAGIKEGLKVLLQGRARGAGGSEAREVMLVVSDGRNNAGCAPVLAAGGQTKSQKVLLLSVALQPEADEACLRQVPSSGRYFYASDAAGLPATFGTISALLSSFAGHYLRSVNVSDLLADNMHLVADSTMPPATTVNGQSLSWRLTYPTLAITLSYWVQPQALGDWPVSVSADGLMVDPDGLSKDLTFPSPKVHVVEQVGLPTPTAFPTALLPPTPAPSSTPAVDIATPAPSPRMCSNLAGNVPPAVVEAAMANPERVGGYNKQCNASLPPGPNNPLRRMLSLQQPSKPYHPLFNGLVFKCGCP